jgi:hypothetical protein
MEKRHALQDYQMQLMLLEQQNKKRLMMGREISQAKSQGKESESSTSPEEPRKSASEGSQEQGSMDQDREKMHAKEKGKETESPAATVPSGSKERSAYTPVQGPTGSCDWAHLPGLNQQQTRQNPEEFAGVANRWPARMDTFNQQPFRQSPENFMKDPGVHMDCFNQQYPSYCGPPTWPTTLPYPNQNDPNIYGPYGHLPPRESEVAKVWPQSGEYMCFSTPPPLPGPAMNNGRLLSSPAARSMRECSDLRCRSVAVPKDLQPPPQSHLPFVSGPVNGERDSWLNAFDRQLEHYHKTRSSNNTKASAVDLTKEDTSAPKEAMQSGAYMTSERIYKSLDNIEKSVSDMNSRAELEKARRDRCSPDSDWSRLSTPAGTPEADGFVVVEAHEPLAIRPAPEKES